ncbi:unnamed protein product [Phyllotreta striolata]|uniref:Uncharacterized protein n=1 Tax=Phyllotreta striolata TaxID=444603 RepID=A0A9N9TL14_PHYSR|nr:unnamed protein product [Phyllotreta striolata]
MSLYSFIFLASCLVVGARANCCKNLVPDLSFKLTGTELAFPCQSTENIFRMTGRYTPRNVIATRMQIYKDDAFVALPRYKHGVPFTLAKFSLKTRTCKATLVPYPCWPLQEEGDCEAFQNVVDLFNDGAEILWLLDIGLVNTLEQPVRRCEPKIVGINLKTNQVVKVVSLQPFVTPESRLQYIIVDYNKEGNPFAYISDGGSGAIIVIDLKTNSGFRVVLPKAVSITSTTDVKDVLYMVLARKPCGNVLYFTYLSSPRLFSIKTHFLQMARASGAVIDVGSKPLSGKIVLLGSDNGAAIFFRYKGESDIFIWNSETAFKPENFLLVQKGDDCRLATQVVPGYKKLMWAIESNFHDYIMGTAGSLGPSMAVHPLIKTCD